MHIALLSKLVRLAPTPPTRYPFCSLTVTVSRIIWNTLPKPSSKKLATLPPPSKTISPGSQSDTENALLGISLVIVAPGPTTR